MRMRGTSSRTDDTDDLLLEGWYFDRVGEETFHWSIGPSLRVGNRIATTPPVSHPDSMPPTGLPRPGGTSRGCIMDA